jgi:diguanylate cyclase (GGDEF)-like protein
MIQKPDWAADCLSVQQYLAIHPGHKVAFRLLTGGVLSFQIEEKHEATEQGPLQLMEHEIQGTENQKTYTGNNSHGIGIIPSFAIHCAPMTNLYQRLVRFTDHAFLNHFTRFTIFIAILLLAFVWSLTILGLLEPVESKLHDTRFVLRNRLVPSFPRLLSHPSVRTRAQEVVMVQITDQCLHEFGKWPWRREYFAALVEYLSDAGAKVIGFDVSFFDKDLNHPAADSAFSTALQRAGNVVLASELSRRTSLFGHNGVLELPSMDDTELGLEQIVENMAHEEFAVHARQHGFVNIDLSGTDGVVRRVPLAKTSESGIHQSLALRMYSEFAGPSSVRILQENRIFLLDHALPLWNLGHRYNLLEKQLGNRVDTPLFANLAYLNYLDFSSASPFATEALSDVLQKKVDPALFRDKIVLIGFNAEGGILDKKLTPFGIMPGVEIQATALVNLLHQSFLRRIDNPALFFLLAVVTALSLYLNLRLSFKNALGAQIILLTSLYIAGLLSFCKTLLIVDFSPLALQIILLFFISRLLIVTLSLRRKMHHLETLNQLANQLFTVLDQDTLCKRIFEVFESYTEARSGVILITDQNTEQVEYNSFGKIEDDFMVEISRSEFRERLMHWWKQGFQVSRLADIQAGDGSFLNSYNQGDLLFFPLVFKEQTYGAIIMQHQDFSGFVSEMDRDFFATLGRIIVAAMENARLYRLATVDGLTGLFVRSFLDVQIQKEFVRAVRYGGKVAFLMSDIDHFKQFNDTYGHAIGDRVLRIVSDQIKKSIREVDIAARYGGEELCVILPNTDKDGAMMIAERIRSNIAAIEVPHEGKVLRVTTSIGVSSIPENKPADVPAFMKEADHALYMAKQGGRNQVRFFSKRKAGEE